MLMTWQDLLKSGDELFVHNSQGDVAKSRAGICARILFLHPHPLTLVEPNDDFISCFACHSRQREGLVFRCDKCDFNLDLKCAFITTLPSSTEKGDEKLRTLSNHEHPLVFFISVPKDCIQCSFCGKYCSVPTYACFPCEIFLHPTCYEPNFPREIQHFYHTCPLTLHTYNPDVNESYCCICRACYEPLQPKTFYYGCRQCDFEMHVDCTLLATDKSSTSQEQIRYHFLHGHPLSLSIIKDGDTVNCYACRKRCTNPTYACFHPSCKKAVYICKTCLELPQEICHPFHPYHPLTLSQQYHPGLLHIDWTAPLLGNICNACRKDTNVVVYICQSDNCSFRLHVGCSEAIAAIEYEGHNHILEFKKIIDGQLIMCTGCNSTCGSYAFSCLYCYLNLHLTCGPLPFTIKHKCHIHPLILTYSLATYEYARDDEFYCDACEEDRDPLLPIYQCMKCLLATEVQCVISKVIPSLKGECGDVELRSPIGQHVRLITIDAAKEMMQKKQEQRKTLYDILKSLSKDENNELSSVLKALEREAATAKEILSYDHDEVLQFSDKAYKIFFNVFKNRNIDNIPIDEYQGCFVDLSPDQVSQLPPFLQHFFSTEEAVNVGDYIVTQQFSPILEHLLPKLGDISAESMLSPRVKVFLFDMLCGCIYSMENIKVVDITHDLLLNWSTILKTLQRAGFKIQFAIYHLKRVSRAHFGLYIRKQVDNALDKIDTDIDRLKKDLEALKVKRELITSAESKKSTFIEKCFREASLLKRWRAGGLV